MTVKFDREEFNGPFRRHRVLLLCGAGFTLIELMAVVAVIAILAAIAIPNYSNYVRRGARADAQSFLMDMALRQQQFLVDKRQYATTMAQLGASVPTSIANKYTVTEPLADNSGAVPVFTLTVTPTGNQVGESCSVMTLNNVGTKTPANCW